MTRHFGPAPALNHSPPVMVGFAFGALISLALWAAIVVLVLAVA